LVENTGSGPTEIEGLLFAGDLPNPTNTDKIRSENGRSGIHDPENPGDLEAIALVSGEQKVLYSSTLPFSWARTDETCWNREGELAVTILRAGGIDETDREFRVAYRALEDGENCQITLRVDD
jgi:hypothetical protein